LIIAGRLHVAGAATTTCGERENECAFHGATLEHAVSARGPEQIGSAVRDPRTARIVTRDLADYHVPTNADVPPIEVIMIDERDTFVNELGAKGIGEIGTTGVAAAVANAVYHATGKRIRDLPITVDKLLTATNA
jgi:xanthine dehydrogenase YagR molybdenum-binding subunit